jgi:hypothetical protein
VEEKVNTFYLGLKNGAAASKSHNQCPENKNKNRAAHIGKPRPEHIAKMLREIGIYQLTRKTQGFNPWDIRG